MKRVFISFLVLVLFVYVFGYSYAMPVNDININLYLDENKEVLISDMEEYIDLVDDNIFINSSFNISNNLNENYDFLTKFAISFIYDNLEYYSYVLGDNYNYIDEYGREYETDKLIDINTLYEVTNSIFGVDYYYILDEKLIIEDQVLLVDFSQEDFNMEIDKITDIYIGIGYVDVFVKYLDNDIVYVYRFDITDDNRLVINNLSIKG